MREGNIWSNEPSVHHRSSVPFDVSEQDRRHTHRTPDRTSTRSVGVGAGAGVGVGVNVDRAPRVATPSGLSPQSWGHQKRSGGIHTAPYSAYHEPRGLYDRDGGVNVSHPVVRTSAFWRHKLAKRYMTSVLGSPKLSSLL